MKKLSMLGILILVAMFSFNVKADIITLDGANEIANAFFANSASSQKRALKSAAQLEYAWDSNSLTQTGSSMMKSVEEDPTFYVFNNPDGEGFVIVSGDSNARSVIGYSYEGSVPMADEIPDPMKDYLLGIDEEIKWARTNLTSSNKNLKTANESIAGTPVTNITTAKWEQGAPFNNLCPIVKVNKYDSNGNLIGQEEQATSAGCIPTAFAIVMRYHQWPSQGIGTITGSYSYDQYNQIPQDIRTETIDHSATTYDWNNMPLTYSGSWTEAQETQVATLLRNLGYAFGVTYTPGNTYVNDVNYVPANVLNCFGYKVEEVVYGNYNTSGVINDIDEWKGKLKSSLINNCPIPYAATNSGTGDSRHMFVVDDYTNSDYFHFNFGWGGNGNGWYTLEAVTPSQGDNYSWTEKGAKHRAYINFEPNKKVTVSVAVDGEGSVTIDGASVTSKEVAKDSQVTLTATDSNQATDSNFYGWMVGNDVVSTENPYIFTATATQTYTAKFLSDGNTVEIYHNYLQIDDEDIKANCSVTGLEENGASYPLGVNLTITANCERGYKFNGWYTVDWNTSENILLSTENPYSFETSEELAAISYSFTKLSPASFTVTTADANMGTATWSYNGEQGAVYAGDEITLTATPKSGYMFTGWSDGTSTISNSQTCTVDVEEGKTYTANFALAGADYIVMHSTGTKTNAVGSRCSTWTYNTNATTNPVALQLVSTSGTTEVFGMANSSDKYYASTYDANQNTGYNTVTYTLSVPEGYIITGYNMTYYLSGSTYKGQVTVSNATSTNTPTDQSDQTLFASGLDGQTTSFTLTASQTGQQAISVRSFTVSVLSTGGGSVTPPATQQYTATVSTNGTGGTATVNGQQSVTVDSGTEVTFEAIPANGYRFTGWSSGTNSVSDQATYTVNISADMNLMANFEAAPATQYTVTVSTNGTGGTATVNGGQTATVDAGSTVIIVATPAQGYVFDYWTVNGEQNDILGAEENPTVNSDLTLVANFREEQGGGEVEVAQLDRTNWSVTASSQEPAEAQWGGGGETRHAIDNSETTFWHSQWDASKPTVPHWIQFNLGGLYEISSFNYVSRSAETDQNNGQIKDYRLYISSEDISVNTTSYVPNGLSPVKDDVFTYNGSSKEHNVTLDSPVCGQYIYLLVDDSYNVDASGIKFANCAEFYASGKPAYTVSATASPNNGGTASVSANVIGAGESVTFTATTNTGYNFLGWYNGETKVNDNLEFTQSVTSNLSLTAKFAKQTFTVSATPNGTNGTATVSPNGTVEYGTEVTFTATANPGYRFVSWSNDETANPYRTTITANTELTATFKAIQTYTVGVTYGHGGTATVSQGTVEENGTVTLTAIANDGYRFTGWSIGAGEIISTANPYTTPAITADVEYVANFVESSDELLLTFACLSDLHAQQDLITDANNIQLRESVTKTLSKIKEEENVDLIVLGGDYTSNNAIPDTSWEKTRELLVNATRGAFKGTKKPVIYVNGNHEYEVANYDNSPREYNAGDYYTTPMKTDIGALVEEEEKDCFYEYAENGTGEAFKLLAAYHYVVKGFDFVVLNAGKNFFTSASNYTYSTASVEWCANKLAQIYETDKNKTVFFLVHIPFEDSNSLNSGKGMTSTDPGTTLLKSTLAQYPNLVMLYGHDHGGDSAYIRTATEQRVTEYATNGDVLTQGDAESLYYIQNYNTGKYLGYNTVNLAAIDNQTSDVTFTPSTMNDGEFTIYLTNATYDQQTPPQQKSYLNCGSSGRFSGNYVNTDEAQQIAIFKVEDPTAATITATKVSEITSGATYMFVGLKSGVYYALTDELHQANHTTDQRMVGAEVTITDGILTYTGDANVLWTINKKPSATEKSFFSSFMGSMRYYNNTIEGTNQLADRRIIQALMVYVYSDRVELKMKNYGDDQGDVTVSGITVKKDLTPYISYRTVTHSAEAVTATPVITSTGSEVNVGDEVTVTVEAPESHILYYYTTDGTEPTEESAKAKNGQITFTADKEGNYTVKVAAQEGIRLMSPVASVTYTVIDTHGITVSTTVDGVDAQFTINETDKTVTLTVAEIEGYEFVNWTMNGTEVATTREATIRYTQGAQYVANFAKQKFNVTVTANPTNGGTVTEVANPVEYGTTLELTATPNSGYQFVNWTLGETVVSNSATFTTEAITADAQYVANFDEVTLEEIYDEMCKPTFTGAGNNTYVKAAQVYGKSIEIPSELLNNVQRGYVPTPIEVVAGEEFVLDLTFAQNWNDIRIYQIENEDTANPAFTYGPYEGSYNDNNGPHPDPFEAMVADGIIVDGTTASFPITFSEDLAVGELAVIRVAVGNVNTPCAAVSGEGAYIDFLFVMVAPATSRTISVEANPAEGGTVTGATTAEGPITLTATANEGYEFVNWTVGEEVVGTLPTITDNSSENITYIANFNKLKEKAPQLTVVTATTSFTRYSTFDIANIKDNNYSTKFWSYNSQSIDSYIQVDLGSLYNVEDIVLCFPNNADYAYGAVLEVSQTATTDSWEEVASFTYQDLESEVINEITLNTYTCDTDPTIARYVRMRITTAHSNAIQLVEFEVYGTTLPRTVTVTSSDIVKGSVFITSPKQEGTGTGGTGTGGTGTGGQSPSVTTNEDVTVLATANSGYRFVNWTIGGNQVGEVGVTTYTYTDDESATITANFEEIPEIYTVSVSSNNRAMGSATMSATTPTVEEGTPVTFTATAYEGYVFVRWQNAQGTQVSTNATYTTTINANTALTAVFQENTGLTGRWYRIKNTDNNVYLNVGNTDCHPTGTHGGVNCIALNKTSDNQLFLLEASGTNYTLKTRGGNYIYCQDWNVDALPLGYEFSFVNGSSQTINRTVVATPLTFVDNGNGTYNIQNGSNYFKVQNVSGTYYPFCDAPSSAKATWILEPVKTSEVSVEKTSDNATIVVKTDAAATIKVGGNTKATEATSATLTIGATDGSVGDDIKIESIDGYITSIECVENIELTDVPVTVTEIALRNVKEEAFVVNAPALSKITVVSDADNNVAKVSTASDLSQGVQVVVEKEIITPHAIDGKGTPTYFNFLSMPFAFNTSSIKYWDGDSWEPAKPESQIRILMYDSQKRANGDLKNTWITLGEEEYVDIAANEGFVIVGHINLGDANHKMKLRFTSATEAYNGSVNTVTANSYRKDSGETSKYDTDWNFNGVPYLTNGVMNGYTLYFHNGYGYEAVSTEHALESEKVISAYQGVMYQANIESGSIEIDITPSSASRITKAADDVFARAYISVDDAAPAKIILSDESSENFVVNEDAWYLAPTANAEPAAYFNIGGSDAAVTVQPAASELPMTVYTGAGTQHRITLTATDGEYEVYLKDAVTDEIVCLNDEDYNFTAAAKTTIANRFTVSMVEPTGIIEQAKAEGAIKAVVAGDVIKLYGTEEGDEVTLYTTGGMVITNAVAEDGVTTIETSATGVLIIKVADQTIKVVK